MKLIIWHNNVCSTSRKALDHLQNQGHEVSVRNYLTEAPSIGELQQVLEKLDHEAPYLLRKKADLLSYRKKRYEFISF